MTSVTTRWSSRATSTSSSHPRGGHYSRYDSSWLSGAVVVTLSVFVAYIVPVCRCLHLCSVCQGHRSPLAAVSQELYTLPFETGSLTGLDLAEKAH